MNAKKNKDRVFITSALMIEEQRGIADMYVFTSDKEYPQEGTIFVRDWPITLHWCSSKSNLKWGDWKLVDIHTDIRPNELDRHQWVFECVSKIVRVVVPGIQPGDMVKALEDTGEFLEVISDPRLGEYIKPDELVDPSWEVWTGWYLDGEAEQNVGSALAPNSDEARRLITIYLAEDRKENVIEKWSSSAFAIRQDNARTYRHPLWDLSANQKDNIIKEKSMEEHV